MKATTTRTSTVITSKPTSESRTVRSASEGLIREAYLAGR